ncbi:hypothetical protein IFM61606_09261 [Aspergillus udagawae]|nr:hypothetical protein IFM61606_09261 [Aspergillus udagawae]GFF60222.1 hypothetical protein IFM51744_10229 [Aspergillus udagawae]
MAHGIQVGSEFTTYSPMKHTTFSVDHVRLFECVARVKPEQAQYIQWHHNRHVPYRWKLEDDVPQLIVEPTLGDNFKKALATALANQLQKREDNGLEICGPGNLVGYNGPVRGLDLKSADIDLAAKSAIALTHLARFSQILGLRDKASKDIALLELSINPKYNRCPFPSG